MSAFAWRYLIRPDHRIPQRRRSRLFVNLLRNVRFFQHDQIHDSGDGLTEIHWTPRATDDPGTNEA